MSLSLFLFRDFPVSLRFLFSLPPSHPHPHIQYRWSWICLDSHNEMGQMDIRNIPPFLFLSIKKRDPIDGDDSLLFLFFWSILSMSSLLLIILYADPHSFFFGWQHGVVTISRLTTNNWVVGKLLVVMVHPWNQTYVPIRNTIPVESVLPSTTTTTYI